MRTVSKSAEWLKAYPLNNSNYTKRVKQVSQIRKKNAKKKGFFLKLGPHYLDKKKLKRLNTKLCSTKTKLKGIYNMYRMHSKSYFLESYHTVYALYDYIIWCTCILIRAIMQLRAVSLCYLPVWVEPWFHQVQFSGKLIAVMCFHWLLYPCLVGVVTWLSIIVYIPLIKSMKNW